MLLGFFLSAVTHGGGGTSIREIGFLQKSGLEAMRETPGSLAADGFCTTTIHSKRKHSKPSLRFAIRPKHRYSLMAVEAGGIGAASAGDAEPPTRLRATLSPDSILSFWDWEH